MGNELECTARFGKQTSSGKALLETSEVIFRGQFRLKIPFCEMKSVKAANGDLEIEFSAGKTSLHLGSQAERWAQKILHPKSRIEKLGVKPGAKISLIGELDEDFQMELKRLPASIATESVAADSEWIFLSAASPKDLSRGAKIAKSLKGQTALWIVYPKGRKDITENNVIASGRKAGLKDVKVVSFSPTHTALKFVLPLNKR